MNKKSVVLISILAVVVIVLIGVGVFGWEPISRLLASAHTSSPDYWPTDGWKTSTPEEQGLDSNKLADLMQAVRERNVQVHSMLIIRNGYSVLDATFYPYDGTTVHDMASVTKSVMTTLIGIAIDQGKLDLDRKLVSFFPDRTIANPEARKDEISIRHLVSMSSGLDCTAENDEATLKEMITQPDYVQFVLDRKVRWVPGSTFVYCSPAIHMLSPILQQATGMPALDFARQYLFTPLGIKDAMWENDPQGYYDGWGDLSLKPQDMAKLGFLFLNKGQWDGKQIISARWVEQASQAHIETYEGGDPYGYGWWIDPATESSYRADGRGGQYIFVLPEWNMIVVTTGGGFEMDEIAELLVASFVDFEKPLPANPEAVARLDVAINAAILPPQAKTVAQLPEMAGLISGKTYIFEPNPTTLERMIVKFDGTAEAIVIPQAQGFPAVPYPVGLDGVFRYSTGSDGRPVAFRGEWIDAQTFYLEYDGIANNDHSLFQFHFSGDQVDVNVKETAHNIGVHFVGQQQAP